MKAFRSFLGGVLLVAPVGLVIYLLMPASVTESDPLAAARSNEKGVRVLFIGNSLTYTNHMPAMIRGLAAASGKEPFIWVQETPGGCTLEQHWKNGRAAKLIGEAKWNYVVLQEQSQRPGWSEKLRERDMYPYARDFCKLIRETGAKPIFYGAFGRRTGDRDNYRYDTYRDMQKRLDAGYAQIGNELSVPVVPVGVAWQNAMARLPGLDLWVADGVHPNHMGSYLTACMFYQALYGQSPVGNSYTGGLDKTDAKFLQEVAAAAWAKK